MARRDAEEFTAFVVAIKDLRPVLASAGRFLLWYDATGGHVAEYTG